MLLSNQTAGQQFEFTQGDNVTLALLATDDQGVPINLTGASLSTQINGANGVGPVTFPNGQHTLGTQSTNPGTFTLALASADTANCGEGTNIEILTLAVISSNNTYFRGANLISQIWPSEPVPQ